MNIRYRAQALADIEEIFQFIHQHSPAGAENVLRAIYAGIRLIAEQPQGAPRTDIPDIRVKVVRKYRYKIFYSAVADMVEIIHIRHTSRQPWP
jgi:plasmid stabilization system protein ParE